MRQDCPRRGGGRDGGRVKACVSSAVRRAFVMRKAWSLLKGSGLLVKKRRKLCAELPVSVTGAKDGSVI